jgi:hypothetical protein
VGDDDLNLVHRIKVEGVMRTTWQYDVVQLTEDERKEQK